LKIFIGFFNPKMAACVAAFVLCSVCLRIAYVSAYADAYSCPTGSPASDKNCPGHTLAPLMEKSPQKASQWQMI